MYIKIKHIKNSLLILACIFFAGVNYLTYVKADVTKQDCNNNLDSDCDGLTNEEEIAYKTDSLVIDTDGDGYSDGVEVSSGYDPTKEAPGDKIVASTSTGSSSGLQSSGDSTNLTEQYMQDLKEFTDSKNSQTISASEIQAFSESQLADKIKIITSDTLPAVDESQIKVLAQDYGTLSAAESKKRMQQDALQYLYQIIYLLVSNAPTQISNSDELAAFSDDFMNRLSDLDSSQNIAYFSDLGDRLNSFSEQLITIETPETMLDLHIKFIRIVNGVTALREQKNSSTNDPLGKMVTLNQVRDLSVIFGDFLNNEFLNYFKQIQTD